MLDIGRKREGPRNRGIETGRGMGSPPCGGHSFVKELQGGEARRCGILGALDRKVKGGSSELRVKRSELKRAPLLGFGDSAQPTRLGILVLIFAREYYS